MKQDNQNNLFVRQMAKLFKDLSHKKAEPTELASPRTTCTRLKKFRETRQDLIVDPELIPDKKLSQSDLASDDLDNERVRFANLAVRNQEAPPPDKRKYPHKGIKNNQNNPADKTAQVSADFPSSALKEVAIDPTTPIVTLKWLAARGEIEVRRALATNENIDSDILHILARDSDDGVKEALLDNKNVTEKEILRLCGEQNSSIAEKAKNKLSQKSKQTQFNRNRAMSATENIDVSTVRSIKEKSKNSR